MGKQVERNFQVEDTLGVISKKGKVTKEVSFVSWNGAEGKVDLRKWIETDTGKTPLRGISLSGQEVISLYQILKNIVTEA